MAKYYYGILLALLASIVLVFFYASNGLSTKYADNIISPMNFLHKEKNVTLRKIDSNKNTYKNITSEEVLKQYILYYAAPIRPTVIRTSYLHYFYDNASKKIGKKDRSSVYLLSIDKDKAVCFSVHRNDLEKAGNMYDATKLVLVDNFNKHLDCSKGVEFAPDFNNLHLFSNPSFNSENNVLLFNATGIKNKSSGVASDWGIYAFDFTNKKLKKVTEGLFPYWVDKDTFVFLSKEGLALFDTKTGSSKIIARKKSYISTPITYAKKADILVWSFPFYGKVYVYKLIRDPNGKAIGARHIKTINKTFIEPRISEDGRFVIYKISNPTQWFSLNSDEAEVGIFDLINYKDVTHDLHDLHGKDEAYGTAFFEFIKI